LQSGHFHARKYNDPKINKAAERPKNERPKAREIVPVTVPTSVPTTAKTNKKNIHKKMAKKGNA